MSKIRVYALAKMFGKTNSEMEEILSKMGIGAKSAQSSVDEEVAPKVEAFLAEAKAAARKQALDEVSSYTTVKVPHGATIAAVAAQVGEKPGNAVKALMADGLMVPANAAAD